MTIQNDTVDMVKRSSNDFSFIETLDSMINNHEFRDGLQDFYAGNHNKYSFVWEALSAIGQDVGETIYENVLNYVDIASNIDLCKVKSLASISKAFGTNFSVLNGLENFPQEIRDMIDVLSINRKYIMQTNFLCEKLVDDIALKAYHDIDQSVKDNISANFLSSLSSDPIKIPGYISEKDYFDYLSGLFYDFMYEMVNLPYNTGLSSPIWWLEERYILEGESTKDETSTIDQFKITHGIPSSFDYQSIVDNIENGTDYLEDYDGYRKECLELEIERRSKTLRTREFNDSFREKYKTGYDTKLNTRYSYYRVQKVKQYIEMIESQYNGINDINKINGEYDIDKKYFVIDKKNDTIPLIDTEKARKSVVDYTAIRGYMIREISKKISQIIIYISKIRDILKIQCQKYYAKGTFNLLSYVINEYLLEFSDSDVFDSAEMIATNVKAHLSSHQFSDIDIIEYFDTTEYFNISCQTTRSAYNKKTVNERFWEESQDENTNSGFSFTDSQISDFYLREMELQNEIGDLNDFLNVVYEYGARSSYVAGVSSYNITQGEDEDVTTANTTMFLSYQGNKFGFNPHMNLKNRVHSSIQVHPYLRNFIEYTSNTQPVVNAFYNDTVNEITEEEATEKLDDIIGSYGETINVAVNNQYDYSGYKTRYEVTAHDGKCDVEGYDGIFFPPAIEDFRNAPYTFINSISSMTTLASDGTQTAYAKYYQLLGYTEENYKYIANQLLEYKDEIFNITNSKSELSDVHDIFKYGTDGYGNMYILLKKYPSHDISYNEKRSTPGQLWIRTKNNPIAFPAFFGSNPAIDVESDSDFNQNIKYLAELSCIGTNVTTQQPIYQHMMENDSTQMSYFYDMEFSSNKKCLFFAVYPLHDISSVGDGKYNEMISADYYKDYQHSDIIMNSVEEWYDSVDGRTKLYLSPMGNGRYSKEDSYNSTDSENASKIYGSSFLGFYKNDSEFSPVFIDKIYDKITEEYSMEDNNLRVSMQIWTEDGLEANYKRLKLPFRNSTSETVGYKTSGGDVEFSNSGGILSFGFLTVPKTDVVNIQSYVGVHNGYGRAEYLSQTSSDYNTDWENNSFDMLDRFFTTVDVQLMNGELVDSGMKNYNINSEASYIPQYPGSIGYSDISQTDYSNQSTNSFELLGESNNNLDATIALVNPNADTTKDISAILDDYTSGIVWEDYDPVADGSLQQYTFNQIKEGIEGKGNIIWSIDIGKFGYSQAELSTMSIVMYNKNTNGKHPYYVGRFIDISATADRPFVSLKDDLSAYQSATIDHEISASSDKNLRVTGTYDYFTKQVNRSDCNHLDNVRDIQMYGTKDEIVVTFIPEDEEKTYYIKSDSIVLFICNPSDLKVFKYYHMLDHRQAVKQGKIDDVYLSAIELSDYTCLSDVPGLGGYDNLDFKYAEQDVFDISSNLYYFPCFNMAYPSRAVNYFVSNGVNKSDFNVVETEGIFNQRNLYKIKIDKDSIFDDIKDIDVPMIFSDDGVMIAYENYVLDKRGNVILDDSRACYDVTNPIILSCIEMYDTIGTNGLMDIDIQDREETIECIQRIENMGFDTHFAEQTSSIYTMEYQNQQISASDFNNIGKLLNIYVNYKLEDDGSITLYFNYYNYINTPYVKISNNKITMDTRPNTYLKLFSGEDGLLNIEVQFKKYDVDGDLQGFSNVTMATYRIFNISDDKPKFIIHKICGVSVGDYQTGSSEVKLGAISKKITISDEDAKVPYDFDVTIAVSSNKIMGSGKYSVSYQSNSLTCISEGVEHSTGRVTINEPKGRTLTFRTLRNISEKDTFSFTIRNPQIFDTDGENMKISTTIGQITFQKERYLRKESTNNDDLILTEAKSGSKKINI